MASLDEEFADLVISENLADAMATVSEAEFERFFESIKQRKYKTLENTKDEALTCLRDKCKMISEMKTLFVMIRQSVVNRVTRAD